MKLAVLADPLDNQTAGVHVYTKAMLHALDKLDDSNQYIIVREQTEEAWSNIEEYAIDRSLPWGLTSLRPWVTAKRIFWSIPQLMRKEKADVVLEPAHFGPFNLDKHMLRVTFIHDLTPIKFPQHHRWLSQKLQNIFLNRILQKSDLIITNSQHTRKDLNNYYPFTTDKSKAILLGKDNYYKATEDLSVLKKYNLTKHQYFLNVGTVEPRKNLVTLLAAYEKYCAQYGTETPLVIAGGKGWKTEEFDLALEQHPFKSSIHLLGFVPREDLPKLYTGATAMIYPSLYEGFGFPILEAMSCGAPVICSNTSSMPEVGGAIPYYISPTDVELLTSHMRDVSLLTQEGRKALKEKSIQQSEKFSWDKHVSEMISTIDTFLSRKRNRQ